MDSPLTLSLAILAISCIFGLIYWRPRRKILDAARLLPGPKPMPIFGNATLFWIDWHETLAQFFKLRAEFGSVVRLWFGDQLMVMLSDPEDIKCFLGNPRVRNRHSTFSKALAPFSGNGLFTNEDDEWKMHRQLITPMFPFKVLESHFKTFAANATILMDQLAEVADRRTFYVYKKLSLCTLDSICETAFGQAINAQVEGFSQLDNDFHQARHLVSRRACYQWLLIPWLYPLTSDGRKPKAIIKGIDKFGRGVISRKMAVYEQEAPRAGVVTGVAKTNTSFLDMLIEASEFQGSILTEKDIQAEVTTIAFAALDTTGITMSALLLLIAIHPEWQDALNAEMSEVFADEMTRPAMHEDLPKMPVLDRVIRETLRMYPITPLLARDIPEDNDFLKRLNVVLFDGIVSHENPVIASQSLDSGLS